MVNLLPDRDIRRGNRSAGDQADQHHHDRMHPLDAPHEHDRIQERPRAIRATEINQFVPRGVIKDVEPHAVFSQSLGAHGVDGGGHLDVQIVIGLKLGNHAIDARIAR